MSGRPTATSMARLSGSASTSDTLGPAVTTPLTVQKFAKTSNNISGTATNLQQSLKELEADLKKDIDGRKEYQDYLKNIDIQREDLKKRIQRNKEWIATYEKNDDSGAVEVQYKRLLEEIQGIYNGAKDFHSKGIDLLIRDFNYHISYKRWNDSFTAVPFKPK